MGGTYISMDFLLFKIRTKSLLRKLSALTVLALTVTTFSTGLIAEQLELDVASSDTSEKIPEAKSIDLEKPVVSKEQLGVDNDPKLNTLTEPEIDLEITSSTDAEIVHANTIPDLELADTLLLLGAKVSPGTATRLAWSPQQSFEGISVPTPVLVVNGAKNGPTLCLTAAVHGDELNGIEIVRRVLYDLDPNTLSGAVIGVPIVNLQGFRRNSRYLTDRRDLNRYFPGNPSGSSASRIAYSFFNEVIRHCDALVDLHTGSFHRTNLPQVRGDLRNDAVVELTHGFGSTVVMHSEGTSGTLRRAAVEHDIPAITLEAGEPMRLQENSVLHGVKGIQTLLSRLSMQKEFSFWGNPEPVYYKSTWIRADHGGILFSTVDLGEYVNEGEVLGTVTDPITNVRNEIKSPYQGRILGMALNQVVLPGFAAYRVGIQASEDPKDIPQEENDATNSEEDVAANTTENSKNISTKLVSQEIELEGTNIQVQSEDSE